MTFLNFYTFFLIQNDFNSLNKIQNDYFNLRSGT